MDRFIDEQENLPFHRDRPTSPTLSLLMGDHKRHMESPAKTPTQEEVAALLEMVHKVVDPKTLSELVPDFSIVQLPGAEVNLNPVGFTGENLLGATFLSVDTPVRNIANVERLESGEPCSKRPRTDPPCSNCLRSSDKDHNLASAFGASGEIDTTHVASAQTDDPSAAFSSGPLRGDTGHTFGMDFSSVAPRSVSSGTFAAH